MQSTAGVVGSSAINLSQSFTRIRSGTTAPQTAAPITAAQRLPGRVICGLFDTGRVDDPIGVCFVHFATGQVSLCTVWDSQTYVRTFHKIAVHEPTEIVLPAKESKLHAILRANVEPVVKITSLERKRFTSEAGMETLKRIAFEKQLNYLVSELADHSNALAALSGVFHHITTSSNVQYDHWRLKHERLDSFVNIDTHTLRSLDLTSNSLEKNGLSVFKFLNSTLTKMGERALKTNILQPLTDRGSIEERLKAVNELHGKFQTMAALRDEMKGSQDLDKLFALLLLSRNQAAVISSTQKVNDIIFVKQAVKMAHRISSILEGCDSALLKQIHAICNHESISQVKELIDESINEDCTWESRALDLKNQQCYAVKAGRNGLLDVSRQVYKVVVDEVLNNINSLAEEHSLSLEEAYNTRRGFYVKVLDHKSGDTVPDVFVNRSEKKRFLECTTLDIMKCNARLDDTVNEILTISNEVIESLILEITEFLPHLFMLAEAIGMLDLLQCFAFNAAKHNYVCPEFSDSITLKASRHPIVETLVPNFITNDVCCIQDVSRFQIITGTNMSGKSVYLRQVAILSIMAQMGSFVPADFASFKIFECLRARISVDTNGSNASTFATEMSEAACIIEDANEKSLIIIDELGRGSSINDAFAITLSIFEHLLETGATVFVATHFHELSTILETRQGVLQSHMKTNISNNDGTITMDYRLTNGVTEAKRYGIKMARNFFSQDIISRANDISKKLEGTSKQARAQDAITEKNKRFTNLMAVLKYVSTSSDLSGSLLHDIQDEFLD